MGRAIWSEWPELSDRRDFERHLPDAIGPLVFFRAHNRKMLVLNSMKSALDLLESRAAIYSDRPAAWMYNELVGRKLAVFNISVKHPRFKIYRKVLQTGLNPRAIRNYRPIQEDEAHTLLRGLATSPDQFISHIRRLVRSSFVRCSS